MTSSQYAELFRNLLYNTVHAFTTSSAVLRFTANGVLKTLKREDMIPKTFSTVFLAQSLNIRFSGVSCCVRNGLIKLSLRGSRVTYKNLVVVLPFKKEVYRVEDLNYL